MNPFSAINTIYLLFFFYGAAFLIMGLAISIKNMKESKLLLADHLWLLGMFGFFHGAREWLEMYPLIEGEFLSLREIFAAKLVSVVMMVISFVFLTQFGMAITFSIKRAWPRWLKGIPYAIFGIAAVFVLSHGTTTLLQIPRQLENAGRNTLGLFGGLVTAYGMIGYSRVIGNLSGPVSRQIRYAGMCFACYGVFASRFFTDISYYRLAVPAEVFRGGTAVLITYFIIRALNIFNIETRRRIEKQTRHLIQAEKLTSLGRLAAGIAHEINNPLTNASLGIQTLRNKLSANGGGQEVLEKLIAVERNIDRASSIAHELLLFSRQRESEFVPLDLNAVMASSLTLMKHRLKGIVVEQKLFPVPEVMGDRGKLEQVFINIISNALEAMPKGGRLSVATEFREGMIEVRIADTGTGIAEEDQSRVFDPFFTTKEVGSGTGLGLSICYGIIQQHQGRIKISSAVGQGTTVTIKLPSRG